MEVPLSAFAVRCSPEGFLKHRRRRTTAGYAHLADGHLVEAVERVVRIIAEAMEGKDGGRNSIEHVTDQNAVPTYSHAQVSQGPPRSFSG